MDWVERVTKLRRYTRGDERAAHKPLLLLCALGRFQHFGDAPIEFGEAEGDLNRLLEEFGPPPRPARPIRSITWPPTGCGPSARHPVPGSPGASVTALRAQHAAGRLDPGLAESLRAEPLLLAQLARAVLDANFEPSLHEDICAAAGLDLEAADTEASCAGVTRSSGASS